MKCKSSRRNQASQDRHINTCFFHIFPIILSTWSDKYLHFMCSPMFWFEGLLWPSFLLSENIKIMPTSVYIKYILLCLITFSSCQNMKMNSLSEKSVSPVTENLLTLVSWDCELWIIYPNPKNCRLYDISQYFTGSTIIYVQWEIWAALKDQSDISTLKDYLSKKWYKVTSIDTISNTFSIQTGILSENELFEEMRLLWEISSIEATFLNQPITLF